MTNNLSKYIDEVKAKLEADLLSPNLIRLANLYYLNEQFDECLETCKAILIIYPEYLTAKVIMLKALLKLRFINEAENLFNEIYSKIEGLEIFSLFKEVIEELKKSEPQEKIFYPGSAEITSSFRKFSITINEAERKGEDISLSDFINENEILSSKDFMNSKEVNDLRSRYSSFIFPPVKSIQRSKDQSSKSGTNTELNGETEGLQHFKLKIVTETIAALYAKQGNYEEAFEAYQLLLKSGDVDKASIRSKLTDIEKLISRKQKM